MDVNKKIAFLVQYSRMKERVMVLIERRKAYESDIYGIKATRFSDEPKCIGLPQGLDNKVIKLLTASEDIDNELKDLSTKMYFIKDCINRLTNYKHRSILEMKYVDGMTIKQMAAVLGCTERNINLRTKKAIRFLPIEDDDFNKVI